MGRLPWHTESSAVLEDRFWDAVASGAQPEAMIDPALVEVITTVHALDDAPGPDSAFVAMLEDKLLRATSMGHSSTSQQTKPNGRAWFFPWHDISSAPAVFQRRRRWAIARLAAALLLIAALVVAYLSFLHPSEERIAAPHVDQDVPMFGGNPGRTGVLPGPGLNGVPSILWHVPIGQEIVGTPAVVDGVAYVGYMNDEALPAGPPSGVAAIDDSKGDIRWIHETEGLVQGSPAVADGLVYAGDDVGNLYALDAATGEQRWMTMLGGAHISSPAVVDGVIYVSSSSFVQSSIVAVASDTVFVGAGTNNHDVLDTVMYAVDAPTGEVVWRYDKFPAAKAGIYALDAATGEQRWMFDSGQVVAGPVTNGQTVIVAGGVPGTIYALDIRSGEQRWQFATNESFWSSLTGEKLGVSLAFDSHKIYSLSSPVIAHGLVIYTVENGDVYALDVETGEIAWHVPMRANFVFANSPVVVDTTVYLVNADGWVFALEATKGDQLWTFRVGGTGWIYSSPVVTGGAMYFAANTPQVDGERGELFALT